jgi:methyltransferase (TIGR00027 family)
MATMTQDIRSGVEFTAVFVAASRAIETDDPDGLVSDPWAAKFVRAAGRPDGFTPQDGLGQAMAVFMGIRSRFFDTYLTSRTRQSRQIVLLAAGLDARAYRLTWPADTTIYELDQPAVLAFKESVLNAEGAVASCIRRTVGVDLRDDWAGALTGAGFDPTQPTLWLIEGLLMYLSALAQEALLDTVQRLSAPGSAVALEYVPDVSALLTDGDFITASSRAEGFNAKALFQAQPKQDPSIRFSRNGWNSFTVTALDAAQGYARKLPPLTESLARFDSYLIADLQTQW